VPALNSTHPSVLVFYLKWTLQHWSIKYPTWYLCFVLRSKSSAQAFDENNFRFLFHRQTFEKLQQPCLAIRSIPMDGVTLPLLCRVIYLPQTQRKIIRTWGKNWSLKLPLGSTTLVAGMQVLPGSMKHTRYKMWNVCLETNHAYGYVNMLRERGRTHLPSWSRKDVFILFIPVPLNNFTGMGLLRNKDKK
jgi:hypothetical protein